MAKGQQRSTREAKKPERDKPKNAAPVSPFVREGQGSAPANPPRAKR
jgi:hypothetical protein